MVMRGQLGAPEDVGPGRLQIGDFNLGDPVDYRVPDGAIHRPGPDQLYYSTVALVVEIISPGDEIWENLPLSENEVRDPSVHLATLPEPQGPADSALAADWERLFVVRDEVLGSLEEARVAKVIGSSLEAQVSLTADGETLELLKRYQSELRYLFIVSQVEVRDDDKSTAALDLSVKILRAAGQKCERCWNYSVHVGESSSFPTVCERCVAALEEIEREGAGI